jgi:hypothetical protein
VAAGIALAVVFSVSPASVVNICFDCRFAALYYYPSIFSARRDDFMPLKR